MESLPPVPEDDVVSLSGLSVTSSALEVDEFTKVTQHLTSNIVKEQNHMKMNRLEAQRAAMAQHRATMHAAARDQEENDRKEADRLARIALEKMPVMRSEQEIDLIWRWLRRRKTVMKWFYPHKQPRSDATASFCRNIQLVPVPRNTLIYQQGDSGRNVYVVVSGSVELLHQELQVDAPAEVGLAAATTPVSASGPLTQALEAPKKTSRSSRRGSDGASAAGKTLMRTTSMGPVVAEAGSRGGAVDTGSSHPELGAPVKVLRGGDAFGHPQPAWSGFEAADLGDDSLISRNDTAVARGSRRRHADDHNSSLLLQVPVTEYTATPLGAAFVAAANERLAALAASVVFKGWPLGELKFLARWMRDIAFDKGSPVIEEGAKINDVFFAVRGGLALASHVPALDRSIGLEHVFAPNMFAYEDALERRTRFSLSASGLTPGVVAALPLGMWKTLVTSSDAAYKRHTRRRALQFRADRGVWYDVRQESSPEVAAVAYDFMLPVQVAWISCGACGGKCHTSDMCPERRTAGDSRTPRRVLPPGSRGVLVNNRLKFARNSSVSSQLYQMGQALMRRTMQQAASTGEDWNVALKVRRKRWAHRAIGGVMRGLGVIRRWLAMWRERRAVRQATEQAQQEKLRAAVSAMVTKAPTNLWRGRVEQLKRRGSGGKAILSSPTAGSPQRRHSSPVAGSLGGWNTSPIMRDSPGQTRGPAIEFEPITSPTRLRASKRWQDHFAGGSAAVMAAGTSAAASTATLRSTVSAASSSRRDSLRSSRGPAGTAAAAAAAAIVATAQARKARRQRPLRRVKSYRTRSAASKYRPLRRRSTDYGVYSRLSETSAASKARPAGTGTIASLAGSANEELSSLPTILQGLERAREKTASLMPRLLRRRTSVRRRRKAALPSEARGIFRMKNHRPATAAAAMCTSASGSAASAIAAASATALLPRTASRQSYSASVVSGHTATSSGSAASSSVPTVSGVVHRALMAAKQLSESASTKEVLRNVQPLPSKYNAGASKKHKRRGSRRPSVEAATAPPPPMASPQPSADAVAPPHTPAPAVKLDQSWRVPANNNAGGFNKLSNNNMHVNLLSSQHVAYGSKLSSKALQEGFPKGKAAAVAAATQQLRSPSVHVTDLVAQTPPSPPVRGRRPRRRFTLMMANKHNQSVGLGGQKGKANLASMGEHTAPKRSPIKENEAPMPALAE